jgi:N,N'-diacetyllegionaminate synthase
MTAEHVTVVAEAAQGFEGNPTVARLLVKAAVAGHADLVKFQLVYADELATPQYPYYDLFRALEMAASAWADVAEEAARGKIGLVFDVYGPRSLRQAADLGAAAVKIHSTDFFNEPLVAEALAVMPQVFFSAGGITIDEVAAFLARAGDAAARLTLLYGFQSEPTATADNHLRRLGALRARFPALALGFMDHADGDSDEAGWLGVLALPYGVRVIEKHLTLDRGLAMEDYVSALGSAAFARYVARIRAAETALGYGRLDLSPPEAAYRDRALKVIVAVRALAAGATLAAGDVALLRTGRDGARDVFHRPAELLGRRLRRAVTAGWAIGPDDLA